MHDGVGSDLRGAQAPTPILVESSEGNPATGNLPAAPVSFDHKIEKTLSAVMVVIVYLTNWYSAYTGHPQYFPEWVAGICMWGFGASIYEFAKQKIAAK